MSKVQGKNITCGYTPSGGSFTAFAYARTASISMQTEMNEVSSPSTGTSKAYIPGRSSWSMSCGCLLSSDESTIMGIYNRKESISVAWGDPQGNKFTGTAYIKSLKATGNIHEMATFDIELQGTGALSYT